MSAIPLIDFMNPNPVAPERVRPTKREQLLSEVGTLLKRKRSGKTKGRSKRKERNVTEVLTQLQQLELIRLLRNLKRDRGEAPTTTRVVGGGRRVRTSFARPLTGSTGATAFRGAGDVLAEQELARKQRESEQKVIEESKRKAEEAVVIQQKAQEKQQKAQAQVQRLQGAVKELLTEPLPGVKPRVTVVSIPKLVQDTTTGDLFILKNPKGKIQYHSVPKNGQEHQEYLTWKMSIEGGEQPQVQPLVFGAREDVARDVQRNQELGGDRRERVNVPPLNLNNGIGMGFMAPVAEGDLEPINVRVKEMRQSQVPLPSPPRVPVEEEIQTPTRVQPPVEEEEEELPLEERIRLSRLQTSPPESPQGSQTQRMGGPIAGGSGITPREREKLLEQQRGLPPYKVIEEERARAPHLNIRATQEGLGEEEFIDTRVRKSSQEMEMERGEEEDRPRRRESKEEMDKRKEEAKAKLKGEMGLTGGLKQQSELQERLRMDEEGFLQEPKSILEMWDQIKSQTTYNALVKKYPKLKKGRGANSFSESAQFSGLTGQDVIKIYSEVMEEPLPKVKALVGRFREAYDKNIRESRTLTDKEKRALPSYVDKYDL